MLPTTTTSTSTLQTPLSLLPWPTQDEHAEICRLLAAAVVNPAFCRTLLSNPAAAVQSGYLDEAFTLNDNELALLCSVQAESLSDFAQQIVWAFGERPQVLAIDPAAVTNLI
jgi:hypothetical protein